MCRRCRDSCVAHVATHDIGSGGRTRTCDQAVNSTDGVPRFTRETASRDTPERHRACHRRSAPELRTVDPKVMGSTPIGHPSLRPSHAWIPAQRPRNDAKCVASSGGIQARLTVGWLPAVATGGSSGQALSGTDRVPRFTRETWSRRRSGVSPSMIGWLLLEESPLVGESTCLCRHEAPPRTPPATNAAPGARVRRVWARHGGRLHETWRGWKWSCGWLPCATGRQHERGPLQWPPAGSRSRRGPPGGAVRALLSETPD